MNGSAWYLVSVSSARASASLRVAIWRRLKDLGAVYLQQSVCMVPATPATSDALADLAERVRAQGGTLQSFAVALTDPDQDRQLRRESITARDREYQELRGRLSTLLAELAVDQPGHGPGEVHTWELRLSRIRTAMHRIAARDYFGADLGERLRAELAQAGHALAERAARRERQPSA